MNRFQKGLPGLDYSFVNVDCGALHKNTAQLDLLIRQPLCTAQFYHSPHRHKVKCKPLQPDDSYAISIEGKTSQNRIATEDIQKNTLSWVRAVLAWQSGPPIPPVPNFLILTLKNEQQLSMAHARSCIAPLSRCNISPFAIPKSESIRLSILPYQSVRCASQKSTKEKAKAQAAAKKKKRERREFVQHDLRKTDQFPLVDAMQ